MRARIIQWPCALVAAMPLAMGFLAANLTVTSQAAEVESRVLTHYVPQDLLETFVRTEAWNNLPLEVKGGVRKGDIIRIWAGGVIDRGNADQPGEKVAGPDGTPGSGEAVSSKKFALSAGVQDAFAILFKTESGGIKRCRRPGIALEINLSKDREQIWIGFNDERGRFHDNHLGKGRRHELDPLWLRIEVIRIIID